MSKYLLQNICEMVDVPTQIILLRRLSKKWDAAT